MDIIVDKGCGLDVHKGTVVACIIGAGIQKEVKTYTTMTNNLLR
jgi:transposase